MGGRFKKAKMGLAAISISPKEGDKVMVAFHPQRPNQTVPDHGEILNVSLGNIPDKYVLLDSFEWLDVDTGIKVEAGESYICNCIKEGQTCENCPLKKTFMECNRGQASHRVRATGDYIKCKNQRLSSRLRAPI